MTAILLSIKPEFVEKILSEEKLFEYRTRIPAKPVSRIFIYATSPVSKCVAVADVECVLEDSPSRLWKVTRRHAGISHDRYNRYFNGKKTAYAFKLKNVRRIISAGKTFTAPQSFIYISEEDQRLFTIE